MRSENRALALTVIVPCYNEEARLREADFVRYCSRDSNVRLLFVDDGSRDGTARILQVRPHCAHPA